MKIIRPNPDEFQFGMNLVDNQDFQNEILHDYLKAQVLSGADVDSLGDPNDGFGLSANNPVPVNGPQGQQTYLSRLRTPEGFGFFFHRLGSAGFTDIYRILSFDGTHDLEVYLNMYHPRRSALPVAGFWLDEEPSAFTGFSFLTKDFPFDYVEHLEDQHEKMQLGYALPEQILPFLDFIRAKQEQAATATFAEPVENHESGADWRELIDAEEWAKSKELRGYIVPTPKDGVQIFDTPNGVYGWHPSKALAKRQKMETTDLYDPAAVMVDEGLKKFLDLLPDSFAEDLLFGTQRVMFDDRGFYTSYEVSESSTELDNARMVMDYLTEFYFPFRTYPIEAWIYRRTDSDNYRNYGEVTLNFRWSYDVSWLRSGWDLREGVGPEKAEIPYLINSNCSLERLQPVRVGHCVFCGEETVIWANQAKLEDINTYRNQGGKVRVTNLNKDERESLISGLHPWCIGI